MNVKSVLFVIPEQFGYSAGYYYYCKYLLLKGFEVGVICVDQNKTKINLSGNFFVKYVQNTNQLQYRFGLLYNAYIVKDKYDVLIFKYFTGVSISSLWFLKSERYLDIRTGSVRSNIGLRIIEDLALRFESLFFKRIFILSVDLAAKLRLPNRKIIYLPLGSDELSMNKKNYTESLNLLYIGTLNQRELHKCIEGLGKFYNEYSKKIKITFDIIGKGSKEDIMLINNFIEDYNLNEIVKLHGEFSHEDSKVFFEKCNYGVSYIPITEYYNYQPPTKTYEYVLSGLVCIGTNTYANRRIINKNNGVLHDDNPEAFKNALVAIYNNRYKYNSTEIKITLKDYYWANIVENIMVKSLMMDI